MFTTNTPCYLKEARFTDDRTDAVVKATFFITPVSYSIAKEIDEKIADAIFRTSGPEHLPRLEVSKQDFVYQSEPHEMHYRLHEDLESNSGMIPVVQVTSLRVFRLFTEDNGFTLAFDVMFPIHDKELAWFFISRIRKQMILSFKILQEKLPLSSDKKIMCETCNAPAVSKTKNGETYVCGDCSVAWVGDELVPLTKVEKKRSKEDSLIAGGKKEKLSEEEAKEQLALAGITPPPEAAAAEKPKRAKKKRDPGALPANKPPKVSKINPQPKAGKKKK